MTRCILALALPCSIEQSTMEADFILHRGVGLFFSFSQSQSRAVAAHISIAKRTWIHTITMTMTSLTSWMGKQDSSCFFVYANRQPSMHVSYLDTLFGSGVSGVPTNTSLSRRQILKKKGGAVWTIWVLCDSWFPKASFEPYYVPPRSAHFLLSIFSSSDDDSSPTNRHAPISQPLYWDEPVSQTRPYPHIPTIYLRLSTKRTCMQC